jgi:predicted transcriptional regulator
MPRNRARFVTLVTAVVTTVIVLLMAFYRASAQVVLKPRGQEAAPLRLKAMAAKVRLEAVQFATTDLDLTFQNEQGDRIEADFLYTVPDGAVVTDFAYFYGTERVPARIAEKERAAAIYQHITRRMRDPALVEMIGKNTFRARIFPVMPHADLRVQIRYVQVLPVREGKTVTYSLPLKASKANRLETVSVDIEASELETKRGTHVVNNFGLPFRRDAGVLHLTFSGNHYRANQDLHITRYLPKAALQAHCLAARSGGPNGFFALALACSTRLRPNSVRIDGIATYDVESVPNGTGLLVTGRYRDTGRTKVMVTDVLGKPLSCPPLEWSNKALANNPPSKLWAGARIRHLSADVRNRTTVVALSQRFGLPSRWTSWIAIPQEERVRYEREKIEADAEIIAGRLARLIEQGKGENVAAHRLRTEFRHLYRKIDTDTTGRNVEDALHQHLQAALEKSLRRAAQDVAQGVATGTDRSVASRRAGARLRTLCQMLHLSPDNILSNALQDERWRLQEHVVERVARGQDKTPAGRFAWQQLRTVSKAVHVDTNAQFQDAVNQRLPELAQRWVLNEHGKEISFDWSGEMIYGPPIPRLSTARRDALKARLDRLAHSVHRNVNDVIEEAETPYRQGEMFRLRDQIIRARKQRPMDPARINELEARFLADARSDRQKLVAQNHHFYYQSNTPEQREAFTRDRLARIAARTEGEQLDVYLQTPPSGSDVAALRARREALKQREEELRVRMGDPLVSVEAPADAQAVVARMPDGTFLPLTWNAEANRWQARFDVPTSATEGTYEVNVTILLQDGTRRTSTFRYSVDLTAPQGTARVTRLDDPGILRLEVDASPDTARVLALLPGDKTLSLPADANHPGHFVVLAPSAFTPGDRITFILTDRAHNRTVLMVTTVLSEARP